MDKSKLRAMFPRASKSFIEANPHLAEFVQRGVAAQQEVDSIIAGATRPKGMLRGAPKPNKTEADYGRILEAQKRRGEIYHAEFQGITLRWAGMRYTPDWFVVYPAGNTPHVFPKFRCIETKGPHIHYQQQAIARYKGAKAAHPWFDFQFWQRKNSLWTRLN